MLKLKLATDSAWVRNVVEKNIPEILTDHAWCEQKAASKIGFMRNGGTPAEYLVDRLLFAAMVEARSCERFKVLSENIDDPELASFYHDLMVSEANHYTLFIGLARKYASGMDVDARWQEWLDYEGEIIRGFGKSETVHG